MYKTYSMELAGRTLSVDIGRVGKQAGGCAFIHYGDTTLLCTATASAAPRDGIDFFPLSVEYSEKYYAVGKMPGGFNKREGKPSENAILTSRVIDRPMRPLFPKDMRNDVTLECMVMSVDPQCRPEMVAMIGASLATTISDIPFDGPCAATQIGLVDGEVIINPSQEQWDFGDLCLTVASTADKVIMIEAGANEIPEEDMIRYIYMADEQNKKIIEWIGKIAAECGKTKREYVSCAIPEEMFAAIREIVPPTEMEVAVFTDDKQTREGNVAAVTEKLREAFADKEEWLAILDEAVYQYEKKTVRKMILKDHKRPDGRELNQIRPLAAEVDLIPRVHGSAMFTRGQTQICNVVTLAPLSEAQRVEGLDPNITETFDVYASLADQIASLDVDQDTLNGYILSSYAYYARSSGELTGALNAAMTLLEGKTQEQTIEYMQQLKALTPESVKASADLFRKLSENGVHHQRLPGLK